jgi:hypothetical protein
MLTTEPFFITLLVSCLFSAPLTPYPWARVQEFLEALRLPVWIASLDESTSSRLFLLTGSQGLPLHPLNISGRLGTLLKEPDQLCIDIEALFALTAHVLSDT